MRIITSENYWHEWDCPFGDCERRYCSEHRLLYRDCDTARKGLVGDFDIVRGVCAVWESDGECPVCVKEDRAKRLARLVADDSLKGAA